MRFKLSTTKSQIKLQIDLPGEEEPAVLTLNAVGARAVAKLLRSSLAESIPNLQAEHRHHFAGLLEVATNTKSFSMEWEAT